MSTNERIWVIGVAESGFGRSAVVVVSLGVVDVLDDVVVDEVVDVVVEEDVVSAVWLLDCVVPLPSPPPSPEIQKAPAATASVAAPAAPSSRERDIREAGDASAAPTAGEDEPAGPPVADPPRIGGGGGPVPEDGWAGGAPAPEEAPEGGAAVPEVAPAAYAGFWTGGEADPGGVTGADEETEAPGAGEAPPAGSVGTGVPHRPQKRMDVASFSPHREQVSTPPPS
ncbi:MAG: hypothetical protein U0Q21_14515 [Dermatophilaceae bacterium]